MQTVALRNLGILAAVAAFAFVGAIVVGLI